MVSAIEDGCEWLEPHINIHSTWVSCVVRMMFIEYSMFAGILDVVSGIP